MIVGAQGTIAPHAHPHRVSGNARRLLIDADCRIDAKMARTRTRPLPTGGLSERQAVIFALVLGAASMLVLWLLVNRLTAVLTFGATLFFYLHGPEDPESFWIRSSAPRVLLTPLLMLLMAAAAAISERRAPDERCWLCATTHGRPSPTASARSGLS